MVQTHSGNYIIQRTLMSLLMEEQSSTVIAMHGAVHRHIFFAGGGYLTQFYPPAADVTYLGITQDMNGKFKFVAAEGVNEEGPIFTFGDTNMRTRFSIGAREFCNRWSEAGPTHHMAAAVGRHIDTILKVAKILDVPVDIICR